MLRRRESGGHGLVRRGTVVLFLLVLSWCAISEASPRGAPAELKVGFVDFFSGLGATFGTPGKDAATLLVSQWNRAGGIRGVKVKLVMVDEAGGPDRQVTEFRRLVLDERVHAVVGYTSSANCLAVAPVAEELRVLTVVHICGTHRLTEGRKLQYVFRTSNHQVADSVMGARYVLTVKPDVRTIAGINEDYSWGRDSWEAFKIAMKRLKPDVRVVAELWTRIQAGEYSAEISRLLAARPDVIHSSFWGGGLVTFVRQASARSLFEDSLVYFSTGEQVLQDMKRGMPDGVIVAPRATAGYFLYPDGRTNPLQREFVGALRARTGRYPDYPAYRTYQALAGLRAAYEKAVERKGRWPTTEEVSSAFVGLTWQTPLGPVTMRADHQAIHGGLIGMTRFSPKYGFAVMDRTVLHRAEEIMPPPGARALDWVAHLKR